MDNDHVGFDALIEAFTIFRKYANPAFPTHCEHDVLTVVGVDPDEVSAADLDRLEQLSFGVTDEWGYKHFRSYRFGSA
jgi:hypothetical protein